jgi:hypothetical protein
MFWAAAVLTSGCASPAASVPFKPVVDVRTLMESTIDPQADVIWGAVGTIITLEGTQELRPRSDEEWMNVRNSAITLTEAGNLLMMGSRAVDNEGWMKGARAMIETGEQAIRAADARDPDELFNAGADIYASCTNCHMKYIDEIANPPAAGQ